ncbi:IS30 family transposase [Leptospira jelokensis]|uniref:IS30 family transposase n=1 Tax=Leptospira jelokensis TaxID=2484931 RepID=A0A4Z1A2J2_9LEPT|nr:IS30 family transposase [Leptospira jelokensis]TGL67431.1 IS30 family transposase [Leptospira jelokensis]
MKYCQLTPNKRFAIYLFLQQNYSLTEIAKSLNRHKSTISREMKRNTGGRGYRYKQADQWAESRRINAKKHIKFNPELKSIVIKCLKDDWSPEQISAYLSERMSLSHETIYKFVKHDRIYGGTLYKHLRQSNRRRRKKYGSGSNAKGTIKNRVFIKDRPKSVEKRNRIGHWEGETIVGKNHKGSIVTLVERKSLYVKLVLCKDRTSKIVTKGINKILKNVSDKVTTITVYNGKEFSSHQEISKSLDAKVYFADPYSFWQRGINESINGLVRQYFPKGSDFSKITKKDVEKVERKLNNRPRKTLGFKTLNEVFWCSS